jgi:hypothetical protein
MPLETAAHINDLVTTNPVGTDNRLQGDDHIRLLKQVLKTDLPLTTPATATGITVLTAASQAAAAAAIDVPTNAQMTAADTALGSTKMGVQCLQVQDQKSSGTNAGSSAVGMNDRTLNTVTHNTMTGASLASNQVTLAAGTYRVQGWTSASAVNQFQSNLYNVTDSTVVLVGSSSYTGSADSQSDQSIIDGRFTLAATKTLKLRTYCAAVAANTGLGFPSTSGQIEVYSSLTFTRE